MNVTTIMLPRTELKPVGGMPSAASVMEVLATGFGFAGETMPIAAVSAMEEGLPIEGRFWLRADPVKLRADLSTAYLLGSPKLSLSAEEQQALHRLLTPYLEADDIQLHMPAATRWYISCPNLPGLKTTLPVWAMGKSIEAFLPQGPEQTIWLQRQTEWQMLLHDHPLIDSLWLWGEGRLPNKPPQPQWDVVVTDAFWLQALAQYCGVPCYNTIEQAKLTRHSLVYFANEVLTETAFSALLSRLNAQKIRTFWCYGANSYVVERKRRFFGLGKF